ncbi:MAG: lysozyme inhibitor LprI family protein [Zoogloeaceae bacterium]|jgi:uncharacterized protein|nr:lysozyme inhibitor LprI family protein [Zoogloeaceae bacterium]
MLCGLALPAKAASFDCEQAKSEFEQAVCDNPKLSALDEEMSKSYHAALEKMADGKAAFRAQQRAWLKWMQKRSAPDLEEAYQWHIQYLNELPLFPDADASMQKAANGPVFSMKFSLEEKQYTLNAYMLNACKNPDDCGGPAQVRIFRQGRAKALHIINMPNLYVFRQEWAQALNSSPMEVCLQSGVYSKDVYKFDARQSRFVFSHDLDKSAGGPYYRSCEYQE